MHDFLQTVRTPTGERQNQFSALRAWHAALGQCACILLAAQPRLPTMQVTAADQVSHAESIHPRTDGNQNDKNDQQ